ncbi:hypothetical protein BY996DRAFT_6416989 [Phakopsora pachyrhizi]|nr:hypothetical protein BY996DRAFT_6416989 [Phakopsora pachyrhizi]
MSSTFSKTENSENLGDNPLDLLLQTLEAQLDILSEQESFIQELAKPNSSAERHAAVVYLLLHNSHKMDLVGESLKKLHGFSISGGDISLRDKTFGSQMFFWTKPPKDLIQVLLHQFFISHDVESYTKGTDSGSIVIVKSLFSMTMKNYLGLGRDLKVQSVGSLRWRNSLSEECKGLSDSSDIVLSTMLEEQILYKILYHLQTDDARITVLTVIFAEFTNNKTQIYFQAGKLFS